MILADTLKLQLLENFIGAISYEDLQQLLESDIIVGKLKGSALTGYGYPFITSLISENNKLASDVALMQAEIVDLRSNLQTLIRVMSKPHDYQCRNDFDNLKNKLGVY